MINIQEILVVNTAGLLILVVSLLSRMGEKGTKHISGKLFDAMVGLTIIALLLEMLSFLLDGKPGVLVTVFQYLTNGYLFFASNAVGFLWVVYVDRRIYHSQGRSRKLFSLCIIPHLIIWLMILCDLFGAGLIFSITKENVYFRGPFVILTYLLVFCDYAISIFLAIQAVKKRNHVEFFPVAYFVLPCVFGTVVQKFFYGLSTGWFCVSIAFLFVQVQLQNQNAFIDELSDLYNRKYYSFVIRKLSTSRKNRVVSGIMLDVNQFKYINDQFGHTVGDDAIRSLSGILTEIVSEQDMAFRLAGDEFVIVSTDRQEQDVKELMAALNRRVEVFNAASGKPYKLSVSMGYALCNTDYLDSDGFLHQMDMMMYQAKAVYYSQKSADRRGSRRTERTNG